MPQDAPNSSERSATLVRVAATVIAVQAILLAVASVVLAIQGFQPETFDRAGAEILALIGIASAVAIGFLARGVAARQRWSRSPVLVLELICLPIAWTVIQNDKAYAGVPLSLTAVAVLGTLAASGQLSGRDD